MTSVARETFPPPVLAGSGSTGSRIAPHLSPQREHPEVLRTLGRACGFGKAAGVRAHG